jgi:PAS domain S-box-containing protein
VDSLPLPDGRTAATGEERVLLTFGGTRDRELLRSWLADEFEVVEGAPDEVTRFDLCLVDESNYTAFESTLAARREAATPAFLPVLVLATEPRTVPDHADDVVVMPTRTELLGSRVRALLRTRRLTREISLFRRAMDEATVGASIARADADQPLVYVNDAFERITGYEAEEVLGRNCRFLQGPDTDPEPVAELRAAIDEGRPTTVVLRNYRADGTPFWNRASITPVRDDGELTHFLGFQTDVTDRVERQVELERERSRFRSVTETANDAILTIDTDGVVRYANPAVESVFGYEPSEIEGEPLTRLMPERYVEGHLEGVERYLETGERTVDWQSISFEGLHADGHEVPLEISYAEYESDDGRRFTGIVRDVTDRVELEQSLREERDLLTNVFESSPVAIVLLDEEGEIVRANERATQILGIDSAEAPDRRFDDADWAIVDPDGEPISSADLPYSRAVRGEHVRGYRHGIEVDGEQRWLSVNAVPRHDDDGDVVGIVATMQDVTGRVRRERELEQYEAVVQSMREGAWVVDPDRVLAFANAQVTGTLDLGPSALVGKPIASFRGLFPDNETYGRYSRYVDEILAGDRSEARMRFEMDLPDGQPVVEVTLAPMVSDGTIDGVLGLSRDVTDRVERDRRISVLDRVLRHNLRNKLNVVLANASELSDSLSERDVSLATSIETAASDLLDLSETARRFETAIRPGQGSVEPVEVAAHVAHVVDEVRLAHDVDVDTDFPDSARALAHESLELAVEELLENAIVHTDGPPGLAVSVTDRPAEGVVEIHVSDEGPGLPEMERSVLLRGAETPLEHMEGLGLWFVNWTVSASGGHVEVTDNEPKGTVVTIRLPRA